MIGLRIVFVMYIAMGLQQAFNGIMRGAGAVTIPMIISLVCMLIRIPVAYFLAVRPGNFRGIFYSMIISSYCGAIMLYVYYKIGGWKKHVAVRRGPGGPGRPGAPAAPKDTETEGAAEAAVAQAAVATETAISAGAADMAAAAESVEAGVELAESSDEAE